MQRWRKSQKGRVCKMRYHNITKDDMLNGDGLRVVLWVAGCSHCCKECHNPITWDPNGGLDFDQAAKEEIFEELSKDYISGITFSGGDRFMSEMLMMSKNWQKKSERNFHKRQSGFTQVLSGRKLKTRRL